MYYFTHLFSGLLTKWIEPCYQAHSYRGFFILPVAFQTTAIAST